MPFGNQIQMSYIYIGDEQSKKSRSWLAYDKTTNAVIRVIEGEQCTKSREWLASNRKSNTISSVGR